MNIAKQLEATLLSPLSNGELIVAISKNGSRYDAETLSNSPLIRELIEKSNEPQRFFLSNCSMVFAQREFFSSSEYKKSFLETCEKLGEDVTLISI